MRLHGSAVVFLMAAVRPLPAQVPSWLAGCWELRGGNRVTLEMWMPPAGGLMLGSSRTVVSGVVREFEQLLLKAEGGELVYTARPSGQAEASFRSTEVSDSGFTVANPRHDFPQRIIYRRRGADSLVARIEGPGPTGTRGFDFPMKRVPCTPGIGSAPRPTVLASAEKSGPNGWVVMGGLSTTFALVAVAGRGSWPRILVPFSDSTGLPSPLAAAAMGAGFGAGMGLLLCLNWGDCDWGAPRLPRLGPRKPQAQVWVGPGSIGVTIHR